MDQKIITADSEYSVLDAWFSENGIKDIFLVCDSAFGFLKLSGYFNSLPDKGIRVTKFDDFQPNPLYESVEKGVKLFLESGSKLIIAVGGGSSIDVAKCIKLYSNMNTSENYLKQKIVPNDVTLMAIPTTAGTGSESTRYAVIYYNGEKQSVSDYSCIPSIVVFDTSALTTLPVYQKKSTMLDALCHAIESFWSVNSTAESKKYSKAAIELIFSNLDSYLANEEKGNAGMLKAANLAGKAINITQTTAGHAMCYKLTSLYRIAHGHAAALCVRKLWPYMIENTSKCIDSRGSGYLETVFSEIAVAMGCNSPVEAVGKFNELLEKLELSVPEVKDEDDFAVLRTSVNPVRLKNNPVALTEESIDMLYHQILRK